MGGDQSNYADSSSSRETADLLVGVFEIAELFTFGVNDFGLGTLDEARVGEFGFGSFDKFSKRSSSLLRRARSAATSIRPWSGT
jgi:hypothetical protein